MKTIIAAYIVERVIGSTAHVHYSDETSEHYLLGDAPDWLRAVPRRERYQLKDEEI